MNTMRKKSVKVLMEIRRIYSSDNETLEYRANLLSKAEVDNMTDEGSYYTSSPEEHENQKMLTLMNWIHHFGAPLRMDFADAYNDINDLVSTAKAKNPEEDIEELTRYLVCVFNETTGEYSITSKPLPE